MFTGIINGQGAVQALQPAGAETRFTLRALYALEAIQRGESIAVNGVCLTVETFGENIFTAYASAETMQRSNLGALRLGSPVNLERALAVGDRLGGHIVSGHVDCLAEVLAVDAAGQSRRVRLGFPEAYTPEVIAKGSVTLDGISLTINDCGLASSQAWLEVNVIPETWNVTTARHWQPGASVNMETDVIGKYVRNMLTPWQSRPQSRMTEAFLKEHGFF